MTSAGWLRWCVAVPALLWTLVLAGGVLGGAAGFRPFDPDPPLTLAESSALRDNAAVYRLVRAGADPNALYRVRAGILRSLAYTMTPLEAAIAERQLVTVRLLVDLGAAVREDNYARLVCFARSRHDDDVVAYVEARLPGHAPVECEGVDVPF